MKTYLRTAAVLLALVPCACESVDRFCDADEFYDPDQPLRPLNRAGVVLSFDDRGIDGWWALAAQIESYGGRATFFVSEVDRLSADEKAMLRALHARGHEIGSHGFRHLHAGDYEREHSAEAWVRDELLPSIAAFEAIGIPVVTFAFPFGEHTPATTAAALRHFRHARGSYSVGDFHEPADADHVFLPAEEIARHPFSCAFAIDNNYGVSADQLTRALERARTSREVVAIYAHQSVSTPAGPYEVDPRLIAHIAAFVATHEMQFYRYRDFAAPSPDASAQ